jgi:molecular chaperone GrpE
MAAALWLMGPNTHGRDKDLDAITRETLLSRFAAYLDGLDHDEAPPALATPEAPAEATDLFSVFVELAALRNEVRTESRLVKEALDRFRAVFDTLQASHGMLEQELKRARAAVDDRERTLLKPLLLDIIDVRDRLAAGLKPTVAPPRRWYDRIFPKPKAEAEEVWREGTRITFRRLDRLLADQRIVAIETVGRPFDPRVAAAVATVENPEAADGIVVDEGRPGFLWRGELLRPAEVIVARRTSRSGDST